MKAEIGQRWLYKEYNSSFVVELTKTGEPDYKSGGKIIEMNAEKLFNNYKIGFETNFWGIPKNTENKFLHGKGEWSFLKNQNAI